MRLRHWVLIGLILLLAMTHSAFARSECPADTGAGLVQRLDYQPTLSDDFTVIIESREIPPEESLSAGTRDFTALVFDGECHVSYRRSFGELDDLWAQADWLGGIRLLHLVTRSNGASDCGFSHYFVRDEQGHLVHFGPDHLDHDVLGGLFLGDFRLKNRGQGLILWNPENDGAYHYAAQHFRFDILSWDGQRWGQTTTVVTNKMYENPGDALGETGIQFLSGSGSSDKDHAEKFGC